MVLTHLTGEVNLRGESMAIGGLKEKTLAALRSGLESEVVDKETIVVDGFMDITISMNDDGDFMYMYPALTSTDSSEYWIKD